MDVLVIGGTGVISRAVVKRLQDLDYNVTVFNRGKRSTPPQDVRVITGDINDRENFVSLMKNDTFDAVIDMIAFNAEDGKFIFETFRDKTKQLIICSSSAVYKRPYKTLPSVAEMETLDDDPAFPYGYNKVMLERYLESAARQKNAPAITVIRPSLTFGPGAANFGVLRQNIGVADRIRKGKPLVIFGDGTAGWTFTFAPDMALAFAGAVGNTAAYGNTYQVASEELHVWEDLYLEIGKILDKEPHLFYLSSSVLRNAAPNLCAHLDVEKKFTNVFDMTKTKKDIPSFRPEISLNEGLTSLLEYFEKEANAVDSEKDALEDSLYSAWTELNSRVKGIYLK